MKILLNFLIIFTIILTGCAPKMTVSPLERFHLADVVMKSDRDPLSQKMNDHAYFSREGSRGYLIAYDSDTLEMIEVVDSRDGNIVGDPEGVTIYKTSDTEGYVILSSQGGNEFNLYDRKNLNFISKFKIHDVEDTDGLDVTSNSVEGDFSKGFLVVQDGRNLPRNQNFKIVSMEEVLQKKKN